VLKKQNKKEGKKAKKKQPQNLTFLSELYKGRKDTFVSPLVEFT